MFSSVLKEKGHILLQETFLQHPYTLSIFFLYFIWYCNSSLKTSGEISAPGPEEMLWQTTQCKNGGVESRTGVLQVYRNCTLKQGARSRAWHSTGRGAPDSQQARPHPSSRHRCCKLPGDSKKARNWNAGCKQGRAVPLDMHLLLPALTLQNTSGHAAHRQLCASGTPAVQKFNGKTETSFQTPTLVPISANPAY